MGAVGWFEHYEKHIDDWGHKRLGFIHTLYKKDSEWIREVSDNDGGHTAPWLAAMSYKYAVTGDESARREAVEARAASVLATDAQGRWKHGGRTEASDRLLRHLAAAALRLSCAATAF